MKKLSPKKLALRRELVKDLLLVVGGVPETRITCVCGCSAARSGCGSVEQ